MATAKRKGEVTAAAKPVSKSRPEGLEFRLYRDNGGRYGWEIVDGGGDRLARSADFASRDDAERAAHRVQDGASSAGFARDVPGQSEVLAV